MAKPNLDEQKIPSGTSWKKILLEIYNFAPNQYGENRDHSFQSDKHPLAEKLGINGYELMLGLAFLQDQKLVHEQVTTRKDGYYSATLILTEKGFEVVIDIEKHRDSRQLQAGLLGFAAVTATTGAMQFVDKVAPVKPLYLLLTYVLVIVGIVVVSLRNMT